MQCLNHAISGFSVENLIQAERAIVHFVQRQFFKEFKVTRAREVLMYRDSKDPKVAQAGVLVKTGRKWSTQAAVLDAQARLRHKEIVGVVAEAEQAWGCSQHLLDIKS